jgi:hypothetical protein
MPSTGVVCRRTIWLDYRRNSMSTDYARVPTRLLPPSTRARNASLCSLVPQPKKKVAARNFEWNGHVIGADKPANRLLPYLSV